ncbi:hypothetical protein OROMI_027909 [Orobanche minor]
MAVASILSAMNNNNQDHQDESVGKKQYSDHDEEQELCDMVMPGFRFHPTEEELVEFYLRRKVEGKRFNVELITSLDLYRYDPWELPALAAIGEKEWYFYVPRDRKYRNGDRPNRVTTSGYWKATGADRMIRSENLRSIGLKKTLVFYSGKAPKGIRTSWIMNEYRLPLNETERRQKAEISLCRVYKRAGIEDHPSLPRYLHTTKASSSSSSSTKISQNHLKNHVNAEKSRANYGNSPQQTDGKHNETSVSTSFPAISKHMNSNYMTIINNNPFVQMFSTTIPPPTITSVLSEDDLLRSKQAPSNSSLPQDSSFHHQHAIDDLHKLVNINSNSYLQHPSLPENIENPHYLNNVVPNLLSNSQPQLPMALNFVPGSYQAAFPDRWWDWNGISEANKEYLTNLFK